MTDKTITEEIKATLKRELEAYMAAELGLIYPNIPDEELRYIADLLVKKVKSDTYKKAAQRCRYYFKHQNYVGEHPESEAGVEGACENLSKLFEELAVKDDQ